MSIRVTPDDESLLEQLAKRLGITKTSVIKLAIRRLAEQEHISTKRVKQEHV